MENTETVKTRSLSADTDILPLPLIRPAPSVGEHDGPVESYLTFVTDYGNYTLVLILDVLILFLTM